MVGAQPLDESIKNRFRTATSNLKRKADEKLDSIMAGSGYKNKRQRLKTITHNKISKQRTSKGALRNKKDIFGDKKWYFYIIILVNV